MGCDIVTDAEQLVHVTGHPRREELKQMYAWLRPRIAIPMHGEARHLKEHAKLAREAGVPQVLAPTNGEVVVLAPSPAAIVDEAPVGRLFRDGALIVPAEEGPVRERRKLSFVGIVVVSLVLSRRGELVSDPGVELDGVPAQTAAGRSMRDVVLDAVEGTLESIPSARRRDPELVRESVRRAIRAGIKEHWGKRPIAKVMVSMVDMRR
jgi:ribonuclease J